MSLCGTRFDVFLELDTRREKKGCMQCMGRCVYVWKEGELIFMNVNEMSNSSVKIDIPGRRTLCLERELIHILSLPLFGVLGVVFT